MTIDALLSHLDGVKETGQGKFIARCPAHDDRSPSLAIKNSGDGLLLVYCHAGCETEEVLSAVGLTFSDLMPERLGDKHHYKPRRFDARQVLEGISHELTVVCLIVDEIAEQVSSDNHDRLFLAAARLNNALGMISALRTPNELRKIRRGES